ncbi:MAG: heme-binding protein, partial [Deltaproteobacteria bacterium]
MLTLSIPRPSITAAAAAALIDAAEKHAATIGLAIVMVVVDESGVLKAMRRMDGAALVAIGVAQKKALTAVGFGLATGKPWLDLIGADPILEAGIPSLPHFTMLG